VFSPDGMRLITAPGAGTLSKILADETRIPIDRPTQLWDGRTGAYIASINCEHESAGHCPCVSPDSTKVLTISSDNTAKLWGTKTGFEIAILKGHSGRVLTAAF
jgi:WD40 repeat protein